MRQIHHPPLRLPRVAPVLFWLDVEAALFDRVRSPSDETTPLGHVCGPCPSSTTQGSFPHRTGIIRPSSLRIRVHVGQQGHLRLYLFEQIVVDRRPGDVPTQGDKSDGERDVPVSRVGIERGSGDVEGIRDGPVCGCTCTPPARLVGFWGIGFLDAGVWAHLRPSLCCPLLGHMPSTVLNYIP